MVQAEQLRARGVDKVVAVLISEPSAVQQVLPNAPLTQDGQVTFSVTPVTCGTPHQPVHTQR
jgi:hypothetical protein